MNHPNQLALNLNEWKIKTDVGFVPFVGISTMGIKPIYKLTFDDSNTIEISTGHIFFNSDGEEILMKNLNIGDTLLGITNKTITNIEYAGEHQTYDVIEAQTHTYFANDILCHNCQFLSSDALLIDSVVLQNLVKSKKVDYIVKNDIRFWDEIKRDNTYLIGVDPSTGSGQDFSVIEIFHFPSLVQVGEYRANTMSSPEVYSKLKYIIQLLEKQNCTVYFSVENNGVGEGIIALYQNDENPPQLSEFVSESGKDKYGMNTNKKTKIRACINLKQIIETNRITIKSKIMAKELKSFVRKKQSYEAQYGSTDDCISATLIILRILEEIAMYEDAAFQKLYSYDSDQYNDANEFDENDEPIPFSMSGNDDMDLEMTNYSPIDDS